MAARVLSADPTVIRSRPVSINFAALQDERAVARPSLLLNLFDDASFSAVLDRVDPAAGGFTWVGHIPGIEYSTVTLATVDGVMSGSIAMPAAIFSVRYRGSGVHEICQIDQSKFPPELAPIPVRSAGQGRTPAPRSAEPVVMGDDASIIDVMVLYTAAAATAAGGTSAMTTRINLGVSETNTSYGNSGVTQRLRLVHSRQVTHTEDNDLAQDLYSVSNYYGSTPVGDLAATLRDTYGADLVTLITSPASPTGCGIAWMMSSVGSGFAPYGFSVTEQSCISPNYTFGHEMGHNMGARHDWYIDSGKTPYTYAHGYIYTTGR